ncbi:HlyC/CorC family transporter [Tessaracoccus sp. MC1679]|uniref:hemolysin family protein n=1 Tax=unclassified Tessaracoccus TaxID=2635419 RepID=UPI0015FFF48C|nr:MULTISPECIES: hemolysin family protein [unclassified Tessaracoccus]MBB1511632.1 HlyC/CorC family transporter [Tessaracoccus sp. MC1627]MBB1514673.1 HlyC/CorC family transporter [Tessaracoccus sp. MC1679]
MLDSTAILIAIALLIGNAFFVGAEFALIAARRTQIEPRAAAGSRSARITLRAMERVSLMMAGAQLGITMCSLGLGAIGEPAVAHLLEIPLAAIGISGAALHTVSFIIALAIVVFLHMVLGEMVPKNIAISGPERSAMILGPILYGIVLVLRPLIWLLNWIANAVLRLLKVEPREEIASAFTADEVAAFIAESREEGLLEDREHQLLSGAVSIGTETVEAVMVPLGDLVTLPSEATPAQVEAEFLRTGYSRFPVAAQEGHVVGYVHLKDFLGLTDDEFTRPLGEHVVRPLATIAKDATLEATLAAMQAGGTHFALVIDGEQTVGAAMLEDVVERLIGEVKDAATVARR